MKKIIPIVLYALIAIGLNNNAQKNYRESLQPSCKEKQNFKCKHW